MATLECYDAVAYAMRERCSRKVSHFEVLYCSPIEGRNNRRRNKCQLCQQPNVALDLSFLLGNLGE